MFLREQSKLAPLPEKKISVGGNYPPSETLGWATCAAAAAMTRFRSCPFPCGNRPSSRTSPPRRSAVLTCHALCNERRRSPPPTASLRVT